MNSSFVLLHLADAISLTSLGHPYGAYGRELNAPYGDELKYKMRHVISKPFFVVSFELFTAMILQSSTPITMLVGSFVESGFVSGLVGPIAVCGGELGSALVVKILFYDLTTILVLLCFLISTCIFMATEKRD